MSGLPVFLYRGDRICNKCLFINRTEVFYEDLLLYKHFGSSCDSFSK